MSKTGVSAERAPDRASEERGRSSEALRSPRRKDPHPAVAVECPACHAAPKERCRGAREVRLRFGKKVAGRYAGTHLKGVHAARIRTFRDMQREKKLAAPADSASSERALRAKAVGGIQ